MFTNLKHLHFLGICGTAMGAVAAALRDQGYVVTGSDEDIYPPMSTFLEEKGIALSQRLPARESSTAGRNSSSSATPSAAATRKSRKCSTASCRIARCPRVLKFFFLRGRHNLVVTGTHGKTTTTSLLTWVLQSAGLVPGLHDRRLA